MIEKLIEEANASGEFLCDDPLGAARNIMYVLEGLKISTQTIGVSEATINQEILYIMKGLVADSEYSAASPFSSATDQCIWYSVSQRTAPHLPISVTGSCFFPPASGHPSKASGSIL